MYFTFLATGDHIVVSDTTYEAAWKLWTQLLPLQVRDRGDVRRRHRSRRGAGRDPAGHPDDHRRVIANPTTKVADVAALARIAHDAGALLVIDSTFTPPLLYRPLADGADLLIHSLTKYINGHGDAMGGAVIGAAALVGRVKAEAMVDVGGVISPFNAWLICRGSITLPLRLGSAASGHRDDAGAAAGRR